MDQIQNSMLQMVQAAANRQTSAKQSASSDRDDFRKMMKQQAAESKTETPKTDAPQDGETLEVQEDPKLQEQMMLAAAAMLQNPVVIPVQEPVQAIEMAPEVQPVVEFEVQPEEIPMAQETVVQAEVLPEAPQVVETTQPQTFQQAAETAEAPEQTAEAPVVQEVQAQEGGADVQDDDQENLEAGQETVVFQDVREVPVKVGEPEAAEQTAEAKPVETQIGETLTEALKSGETRVELQLTPENLGKVTIEVTMNQDGGLHIALHAENPQTRSLLARDLTGLQMMLARDTRQDVQVEIPQQQESRNIYDGQQGQEHRNPHQQQRREERRENTEDFLHQLRLGLIPVDGE